MWIKVRFLKHVIAVEICCPGRWWHREVHIRVVFDPHIPLIILPVGVAERCDRFLNRVCYRWSSLRWRSTT